MFTCLKKGETTARKMASTQNVSRVVLKIIIYIPG